MNLSFQKLAAWPLVIALLALAVALPGAFWPKAVEATGNPAIHIVSHDSTIRFGSRIDLSLQAASDGAPITQIRAVFRPQGPRTISTYSYPEFSPASSVTARFTIPTAEPTFYPPGVIFEVRYEITDSAGNRFDTDPILIEYLDPEFQWRRATRGALTVLYHDRTDAEINRLLEAVMDRMPRIEAVTGADSGGQYRAVLYNSNAEARRAFPSVSKAAADGHVFAGFAYEQYGIFVLDHAGVQGVTHELAHLVFGRATSHPAAKRPAWLNEGLAVYFETGSRNASRSRISDAIRRDSLLPLRSIGSIPGRPEQIGIFYPQVGDFAGYLIEALGEELVRDLIAAVNRGALPSGAVQSVYGMSLDELENEWRKDIGARLLEPIPTSAAPDPGPTATITTPVPVATATVAPQPGQEPATGSIRIWWVTGIVAAVVAASALALFAVSRVRRSR